MVFMKTERGHQVLSDRSLPLTPQQRYALILMDGERDMNQVLTTAAKMGVTHDDILQLCEIGLLVKLVQASEPTVTAAPTPRQPAQSMPVAGPRPQQATTRSDQQRYYDAIPIATKLTAALGLRGFRLNMAVEAAADLDALLKVAVRIRESVGPEKCAQLDKALYG